MATHNSNNYWVELTYNESTENMTVSFKYYMRISEWYSFLEVKNDNIFDIVTDKTYHSIPTDELIAKVVEDNELSIPSDKRNQMLHPAKSNAQKTVAIDYMITQVEEFLDKLPIVKASEFVEKYEKQLEEFLETCPRKPADKPDVNGMKTMSIGGFKPMPTGDADLYDDVESVQQVTEKTDSKKD